MRSRNNFHNKSILRLETHMQASLKKSKQNSSSWISRKILRVSRCLSRLFIHNFRVIFLFASRRINIGKNCGVLVEFSKNLTLKCLKKVSNLAFNFSSMISNLAWTYLHNLLHEPKMYSNPHICCLSISKSSTQLFLYFNNLWIHQSHFIFRCHSSNNCGCIVSFNKHKNYAIRFHW